MSYGFGYLNDMVHNCGTWADGTFTKATTSSIAEHLSPGGRRTHSRTLGGRGR
jgi:hypothetical protein